MTPTFAIDCYRPGIEQVSKDVFATMLGTSIEPLDDSVGDLLAEFTAAVYYAGTWQGALLLECSTVQALDWAARLMSLPPPISSEDALDGLGELANVIAGNLKPLLPPGVGLSIPSVVQGTNYSLRVCGGNLVEPLDFADASGRFRITLVEVVGA
jgi:chemotaxis protein CheX